MTIATQKHYEGCYRMSNGGDVFGQIKKDGRKWNAEIRNTKTGDLTRFAGVWNTKRDAVEEITWIMEGSHA